jgi:hypothetical protein
VAGGTQEGPTEQAPPSGLPEPAEESPRRSAGSPGASSGEDAEQQALRLIPGLDRVRAVTDQLTVNIGVLAGSIQGGTVSAAGQSSRAGLGEATSQAGVTHWQVQAEELHRLHQVFVPVSSVVEPATKILESRHVLVLQGRTHWGKSTTAQWLLTHRHYGRIFLVDPRGDRKLGELTEALEGDGYVLDTLGSEHAKDLRPGTLLRLSEHLKAADRSGHLVITVDALTPLPPEIADYLVVCQETPDPSGVLWRHLAHAVGDDSASEVLIQARDWVAERYRNGPSPGRMRDLADALAAMVRHGGRIEVARQVYEQRLLAYVGEWFRQHPGARERCFMTAAAVLNGASYQYVSWAAERLERLLRRDDDPVAQPIPRGWDRPFSPRLERVEDIGAKLRQPTRGSGSGPLAVVELDEPLVQAIVLVHLWDKHDDIFNHLFAWLDDLGRSQHFELSGRAAAAAGTLCAIDFDYLQDILLWPWASDHTRTSTGMQRSVRISAAVALTTAAREPTLVQPVLDLLQRWSGPSAGTGLPWTAATTFGMLDPEPDLIRVAVLEGLRGITEHHFVMSWVVAHSLANLCRAGYASDALSALWNWLWESPPLGARARTVLDRLLRLRLQEVDGGLGIPVLLDLSMEDSGTGDEMRHLWYELLACGHPELEEAARRALANWLALTDDDQRCHNAVWVLLHPLLQDPVTRQQTRKALRRYAFEAEGGLWTATQLLEATRKPPDVLLDWAWRVWQHWRSWFHQR